MEEEKADYSLNQPVDTGYRKYSRFDSLLSPKKFRQPIPRLISRQPCPIFFKISGVFRQEGKSRCT